MIYPHKGGFREAGTIGRAYLLNNPLQCVRKENASGSLPAQYSKVRVDAENVITEVVKEAESGTDTILRLYESFNRRTKTTVRFGTPVKAVQVCNMLEEAEEELGCGENSFELEMMPYEIKTLRVIFQ